MEVDQGPNVGCSAKGKKKRVNVLKGGGKMVWVKNINLFFSSVKQCADL
jgi:hypothetical protein